MGPQNLIGDFTNAFMIFGNENGFTPCHGDRGYIRLPLTHASRALRIINSERGSFPDFTIYVQEPVMLFHNPVYGRQSKSCPFAEVLSGEERLEEAVYRRGIHANAGVGDHKHHITTGATVGVSVAEFLIDFDIVGLNDQPAAPRHRVLGIYAEIHTDLANLRCVALYDIKTWVQNDF